jgi:hypothetical protein
MATCEPIAIAVGACVRGDDEPLALKNGVADGG